MSDALQILPTILLELPDRQAYLDAFYHQTGIGGVFVPGNLTLEPGSEVQLEITFKQEDRTFSARGVVRWSRSQQARNLAAGLGIDFLESERGTRDKLLDFAKGREIQFIDRRDRRLPIKLSVSWSTHSVFLSDMTDDISEGGMFIQSQEPLEVGTPLRLKLKLPDKMFAIQLRGEVVWRQDDGCKGFGVRFVFDSPRTEKKVRALLTRLREKVKRELEFHSRVR